MKQLFVILLGMITAMVSAEEAVDQETNPTEIVKQTPKCFGTILSSHREVYFGFCLENDTTASVTEHSNKARGRKSPYRCWSKGEYKQELKSNSLELDIIEGKCNKNKVLKATKLSCKSTDEDVLLCEFDYRKGKQYKFTKARKRQVADRDLCKKDKNYFSQNKVACKIHFGMKSGIDINGQRQMRVRMRAETRHGTQ